MIENIIYLFSIFALGFLLRKKFEKNIDGLIDFVIYISLPAIAFSQIYRLNIDFSQFLIIAFGWIIIIFSIFFSYFVGKILKLPKKSLLAFIMVSSFGNTAFLGYPYTQTLLGDEALGYTILFDNFASFLPVITIGSYIVSLENKNVGFDIKKILNSPAFIALILAILLKPIKIDESILDICDKIGATITPLALFTVGAKMDLSKLKHIKYQILFSLMIKMVIVPILAILIWRDFFGLDLKSKAALLEISMPPMVLASIMVMKAKLDSDLAAGSVGLGVILSFVTVPLMIYLMS